MTKTTKFSAVIREVNTNTNCARNQIIAGMILLMNNKITNLWRSLKCWFALKPGNNSLANQIFKAIENSAEFSGI